MKNFKDSGFRSGGKDFGGRPKFGGGHGGRDGDRGGRSFGPKEMFSTTCSTCGKSCEVPFRPSGDKPVYCSACFNQRGGDEGRDSRDNSRGNDRGRNEQRSERTDFTKPVRVEKSADSLELEAIKRQLVTIESRLNRILDIINPPMPAVKAVAVEKAPIVVEVKKVVTKKVTPVKAVKKVVAAKKVVKKTVKAVAKKIVKKATKKGSK